MHILADLRRLVTGCIVGHVSVTHVLLGFLADGDRHGYDLKRQHDVRFPAARPLAAAQIYATLNRMRRDGLVDVGATEQAGGPERTAFSLTATGRAELERWLADVEEPAPYVVNSLFVKVVIALLVCNEATAANCLRRQRHAHLARMREYTRVKSGPGSSLTEIMAADYAINHLDADLRWIETALSRCTALAEELTS